MKKKQLLLALALATAPLGHAQTFESASVDSLSTVEQESQTDDSNFTFTESQLSEHDDITSDVIHINSATNVYTSQIGWTWSGIWFKYRALDNAYNDIYMNGVQVNNPENGRFSYSTIGGMNDAVRNKDDVSPFEGNNFSFSGLGGSSNYNLRASQKPAGHKVTLSAANRNYTLRGMYSYGTGLSKNGWAFFGTVGYRWANMRTAAIKGTFYNSLAYFMAVQRSSTSSTRSTLLLGAVLRKERRLAPAPTRPTGLPTATSTTPTGAIKAARREQVASSTTSSRAFS